MSETKSRTRTGIVRTVLLRPEQDEALNRLLEEIGMNRNQLVRLIAEKATWSDIDRIMHN